MKYFLINLRKEHIELAIAITILVLFILGAGAPASGCNSC